MNYLRIRNWDKFQHYKDRAPPWIKLYMSLLDDYEFSRLQDASKLLLYSMFLIAGRTHNKIPADPQWIQRAASLQKVPDLAPLIAARFLEEYQALRDTEQIASNTLADCEQSASTALALARSREGEQSRAEGESAGAPLTNGEHPEELPAGLDASAWARFLDYRQKIRKTIKPVSMLAAQRKLAGFGADQAAVVEQSIANGWEGLFALKDKPKREEGKRGLPTLNA